MGFEEEKKQMEENPGLPPFLRRWAKEVNAAVTKGALWATTTTTTTTSA